MSKIRDIHRNLLFLREAARMGQQTFGEVFGLTRDNIASYERGTDPRLETIRKITRYFNITIDDLVNRPLTKDDLTVTADGKYLSPKKDSAAVTDPNSQENYQVLPNCIHLTNENTKKFIRKKLEPTISLPSDDPKMLFVCYQVNEPVEFLSIKNQDWIFAQKINARDNESSFSRLIIQGDEIILLPPNLALPENAKAVFAICGVMSHTSNIAQFDTRMEINVMKKELEDLRNQMAQLQK